MIYIYHIYKYVYIYGIYIIRVLGETERRFLQHYFR